MTTFGIEWDTNALLSTAGLGLNVPWVIKTPVVEYKTDNGGWTISTEKTRQHDALENLHCLLSLEMQMGVFYSEDSHFFNIKDFSNVCDNFVEYWKTIMNNQYLTIQNNNYDILATYATKDKKAIEKCVNEKRCFLDCDKNINEYKTNNDVYKSYVSVLDRLISGKLQITIGIPLNKIKNLFLWYHKNSANNTSVLTVINSQKQHSDEIISFIILVWYYWGIFRQYLSQNKTDIFKEYFNLKYRTNLRVIYDSFSEEEQMIIKTYVKKLIKESQNFSRIVEWLEKLISDNPKKGYVIDWSKPVNINVKIPKFAIFNCVGGRLVKLKKYVSIKRINIDTSYWEDLPIVKIEEGENGLSLNYETFDDAARADIGEWNMEIKDNVKYVIMEIRSLKSIGFNSSLRVENIQETVSNILENISKEVLQEKYDNELNQT